MISLAFKDSSQMFGTPVEIFRIRNTQTKLRSDPTIHYPSLLPVKLPKKGMSPDIKLQ